MEDMKGRESAIGFVIMFAGVGAHVTAMEKGGYDSSQTFFEEFSLEMVAPPERPVLFVATGDSFANPVFQLETGSWESKIKTATWAHRSSNSSEEAPSKFQSRFLMPIHRELLGFRSSLPILVIDTEDHPSNTNRSFGDCFWGIIEPSTRPPFPGEFTIAGRGGVKGRGSSSHRQSKIPMGLEFRNWSGDDKDEELLGMPASSDWVLSPPSEQDPSLLRNPLIFALSRDCGQYAPRTQFVEVFLNYGNRQLEYSADYFGVFAFTEKIKEGEGRVRLEPEPLPNSERKGLDLAQGIIFKFDRPGPGESGLRIEEFDTTIYLTNPKESHLLYRDSLLIKKMLGDFALALKSQDKHHPKTKKPFVDYIDAPSWHTWRWLGELSKNVDLYRASSYFHIPISGPHTGLIKAGPVWDFDRSIDSVDSRDDDPHGWVSGETWLPNLKRREAPWWHDLLNDPSFRRQHCEHWKNLRKGPLSWKNIDDHLKRLKGELTQSSELPEGSSFKKTPIARNSLRWPVRGRRARSFENEISHMSSWIQKRLIWIDGEVENMLAEEATDFPKR